VFALAFIIIIKLMADLYASSCGLLYTDDSYQYMSASQSFAGSGTLLNADGGDFTMWPPLFPVILSAFNNFQHVRIFFAILTVFQSLIFFEITKFFLKTLMLRLVVMALSLWCVQSVMISAFLWSELVFTFLFAVLLYSAILYLHDRRFLWVMSVSGLLMGCQRNAGFFILIAVGIWLVTVEKGTYMKRIMVALLFIAITSSGLVAWNIYRFVFTNQTDLIIGDYKFMHFFGSNANIFLRGIGRTFLPWDSLIAMIFFLMFIFGVFLLAYRCSPENKSLALLLLILVVYIAGFCSMEALKIHEVDRYIAPIMFVIFTLVIFCWARLTESGSRLLKVSAYVMLCFLLVYSFARTAKNVRQWHQASCQAVSDK
jgi:hypothetical protein